VRAVVVEDSPLFGGRNGPQPRSQYERFRDLAASDLPLPEIVDQLAALWPDRDEPRLRMRAQAIRKLDPEVLTMAFDGRTTEHFDLEALLPAIACPLLILRAYPAEGSPVKDQEELQLRRAVKDLCVVRFPGVGHTIQAEQPDWYGRVVSDFLESLE
jgi:pimeloyl-ACP methyl ester carboxylesterase